MEFLLPKYPFEVTFLANRGKVFTLKTLDQLIEHTGLKGFKTKEDTPHPYLFSSHLPG